jgi:hypothetical protein
MPINPVVVLDYPLTEISNCKPVTIKIGQKSASGGRRNKYKLTIF